MKQLSNRQGNSVRGQGMKTESVDPKEPREPQCKTAGDGAPKRKSLRAVLSRLG